MPEVNGLYKICIEEDNDHYRSVKLITEIEVLKECDYELTYDSINETYSFFFVINNKSFCIDVFLYKVNNDYLEPIFYKIDDGSFIREDVYCRELRQLKEEMNYLFSNIHNIILNSSVDKIKLLLKKWLNKY